jgi:hypothetical protein
LGLPEYGLTHETVMKAWKKCAVLPTPIPTDDYMISINTAKDILVAVLKRDDSASA